MSGVTDPTKISVNGPTTAAPLQSLMSYLRNFAAGALAGKFTKLTLSTVVDTPAVGQVGLGDTARIVVGSGAPAPAYAGVWVAGTDAVGDGTYFIKLPTGLVIGRLTAKGGASGSTVFTFPSGYRPQGSAGTRNVFFCIDDTTGALLNAWVDGVGVVTVNGQALGDEVHGNFSHYAVT